MPRISTSSPAHCPYQMPTLKMIYRKWLHTAIIGQRILKHVPPIREKSTISRKQDHISLSENGTFRVLRSNDVRNGQRVFGVRFVDELKRAKLSVLFKSRLFPQNYCGIDASPIGTKAPTVQRYNQRTIVALEAYFPDMVPFTRDITHAYVQSTSTLEREVY